ncbi:MAG: tRNA (adenosine(37)-N6)-threonylcarbamoyltransferase complex dimerization subunit type 1 TsaB [Oscillospiraceae bacterium]|nr:tRNA (adenosine(37)-N6)-threonylcarbamoyltransferase complex dimerization subunit type 1 TsaB [Oscillospiraceae bacterium]
MILAFETSAKAASVALLDGGILLGESYQNTGLTHSQTLLSMAEELLKTCGKTPADVTAVAVANGPGSFTGVRIGVAAAKGFAWGKEIPCYGVSTLEAMARNLGVWEGTVVPAMDARRNQTYTAIFRAEDGKLRRMVDDCAISVEELGEKLIYCKKPIFLVGDGAVLCYNMLKDRVPGLVLPPEHRRHQRAAGVALLAQELMDAGVAGDGASLTPNYLRLSQAERERLEKEK